MAIVPRNKPLRLNVTEKEKDILTKVSDKLEISVAELLRRATFDYIERKGLSD